MAECDENLVASTLTPAERAYLTDQRKNFYEALHPETRHGGDRKSSSQLENLNPSFVKDTAESTGRGASTIARDAQRGANIPKAVFDEIRGTELDTGVVLDKLAAAPDPAAALKRVCAVGICRRPSGHG